MFPRLALVILGLLVTLIAIVVVIGHIQAREAQHIAACERGVARPYQQLMTYMRQLAEAGRFEELRTVIIQAQQRSGDISRACKGHDENIYSSQVEDLTKSNQPAVRSTLQQH